MRDTDTCGDVSPRSTTPDPANPKVRDAFITKGGSRGRAIVIHPDHTWTEVAA
jgi:hypothetical protein